MGQHNPDTDAPTTSSAPAVDPAFVASVAREREEAIRAKIIAHIRASSSLSSGVLGATKILNEGWGGRDPNTAAVAASVDVVRGSSISEDEKTLLDMRRRLEMKLHRNPNTDDLQIELNWGRSRVVDVRRGLASRGLWPACDRLRGPRKENGKRGAQN